MNTLAPTPPQILVTCLANVEIEARRWQATHVISLVDPDLAPDRLPKISFARHQVFRFFDQERESETSHFDAVAISLVDALRHTLRTPQSRLLVHCHAGVSRSTAVAYAALTLFQTEQGEASVFDSLLRLTCKPWPNRRLVLALDKALGRGGMMLPPLDEYRGKYSKRLEAYRKLNKKRGLVSPVER